MLRMLADLAVDYYQNAQKKKEVWSAQLIYQVFFLRKNWFWCPGYIYICLSCICNDLSPNGARLTKYISFSANFGILVMSIPVVPYWRRSTLRPSVEFVPGLRKKTRKTKGGLNQGPWATTIFFNLLISELLHNVIHLMR